MSIFGQVWLWSVAAFALGALLSWILLARPAQARVRELERRLVKAEVTPAAPPRDPEPTRVQPPPAKDDEDNAHTQQIQRVPQQPSRPEPGPKPVEHVTPAPAWLERDSFGRAVSQGEPGPDETIERELAEYDWDADPEPVRDESRYDDTGYEAAAQQGFPELDDRAPEREHSAASLFQPGSYPEDDNTRGDHDTNADNGRGHIIETYKPFEPVYVGPQIGEQDGEQDNAGWDDEPENRHRSAEPEETEPEPEAEPGTAQGLPKRHRRESPRGGFDPPRPIQPSMRTVSRRDPPQEQGGTHSGSLFEPAVPSGPPAAEPAAPMPPPARDRDDSAAPVPSGPFGPGSAMPLPGGGRPGPDFTVKASVTALRYCNEGSAQFPQMVAEVWFRSAKDAERVGFRPVT